MLGVLDIPPPGPLQPEPRLRHHRVDKKEIYARFGVKESWIGDPANKTLEVLTLKNGRYELHRRAEGKGKLDSLVLAWLEFDLTEIQ